MKRRPIFYDTETTGIKADRDRIVEIAAYDPEQDRSFVEFVNPGIPIPQEVIAVHGITDEMVASAGSFADVGQSFFSFCEGDVCLIAHNNDRFDIHFLRAESERHGLDMPPCRFLDSLRWARRYRPDLPRHGLQFLRETYGIQENNAHRALDDVMILAEIFQRMTGDLPLEQVEELLSKKTTPKAMPFGKYQGQPLNKVPQDYVRWLKKSGALDKEENAELADCFTKLGLL